MYDLSIVKAALINLVGFKATTAIPLDSSLTTSESGELFNHVHPQLTPKNLKSYTPDEDDDEADAQTRLENFLTETRDSAIIEIVNRFANEKIERGTTKEIFSNRSLFNGAGVKTDLSANNTNYVGWMVSMGSDRNILTKVRRLSFQGTRAGAIDIHLMNDSSGIVSTVTIDYTTPNAPQWFDVDFSLKGFDPTAGVSSNLWFVGYDNEQYAGQAINKGVSWYSSCRSCGTTYEQSTIMLFNKNAMGITPVEFKNTDSFDSDSISVTTDTYGINLDVWAGCDYTQFIVDNAYLFTNTIKLGVGVKLLQHMLNNPDQKVTRNDASISTKLKQVHWDLYGDPERVNEGLIKQYKKAFDAIQVSTQGLSSQCFKNDNRGKIKVMRR